MQIIWTWRLWGWSVMRADYYGWRLMLHIGPLNLFVGYA
jgi:hypothetical protein